MSVSFGLPVPEAAGLLMPATMALDQLKVVPATLLVGVYENTVLLHIAGGVSVLVKVAVGYTVMVNDIAVPGQPLAEGVIVTVELIAVVPELVAVKDGIFPVPLAASPMAVLLLVHEKVVPVTGPDSTIMDVMLPLQYV